MLYYKPKLLIEIKTVSEFTGNYSRLTYLVSSIGRLTIKAVAVCILYHYEVSKVPPTNALKSTEQLFQECLTYINYLKIWIFCK